MTATSGIQYVLDYGGDVCTIAGVGATLRAYSHDGAPVIQGFDENEISPSGRGQVLAPFPNRLEDGSYTFDGKTGVVPLNEPERQNAIHGLVRWSVFEPVEQTASSIRLALNLPAQPAYPWSLRLELIYTLGEHGLSIGFFACNVGDTDAPFGIGFHPYLDCGPGGVDAARLSVAAQSRLVLNERALPTGTTPLAGTPYDRLVDGIEPIGDLVLDDCLCDLEPVDGVVAHLTTGEGRRLVLRADPRLRYLMCFTGDPLAPGIARTAVALEPMSCPPNALRTGTDLFALAPGGEASGSWGIEPLD